MATGGTSEKNDEDFRYACTLCMEPYRGRSPKILPCFHTFCLPCLTALEASVTMATSEAREGEGGEEEKTDDGEEHADSQAEDRGEQPASGSVTQDGRKEADSPAGNQTGRTFLCPTCRAPVTIPEGGVASLQTNFYVDREPEAEEAPPPVLCDMCEEGNQQTATLVCQDCRLSICRACRRLHDMIARDHHVTAVSLGQPQGQEKKEERKVLCPVHRDQVLCFHCRQCQMNICLHCKFSSHEGHDTVELARAVVEAKEQLTSLVTEAQQQIHVIQSSLRRTERKERQLTRHVQEVTQKVHTRFDQLVRWGQNSRDRVLQAVSCKQDADSSQLEAEKSTMTVAMNMLSSLVSRATAQSTGNDPDVMMLRKDLKAALLSDELERHRQEEKQMDVAWSWRYDDSGAASILQADDIHVYMGSLVDGSTADDVISRVTSFQELASRVDRLFNTMSETTSKISELTERENDHEKKIVSLGGHITSMKTDHQTRLGSLKQEVRQLRKSEADSQAAVQCMKEKMGKVVSFFARGIDRDRTRNSGLLVFKDLLFIQGGDYNNSTGVFTAAVPGTYVFTAVTGSRKPSSSVLSYLCVNGISQATLQGSAISTGSASLSVCLKAGDKVCVEATSSADDYDCFKTSFTGTLVQPQF